MMCPTPCQKNHISSEMKKQSRIAKSYLSSSVLLLSVIVSILGVSYFLMTSGPRYEPIKDNHIDAVPNVLNDIPKQTFSPSYPTSDYTFSKQTFLDILGKQTLDDFTPLNLSMRKPIIADIDLFNNVHLAPRLESISSMDYFRFIKLNLNRPCTLWSDDTRCSLR